MSSSAASSSSSTSVKKDIPRASNPLKSFNWSKLPDCKVDGTIWTEIDETRLYRNLNLTEIDRLFSAYHGKNGMLVSQAGADVKNHHPFIVPYFLLLLDRRFGRGPEVGSPRHHGEEEQDHLCDRREEGAELHHPPLQAQDDQRGDHQVR